MPPTTNINRSAPQIGDRPAHDAQPVEGGGQRGIAPGRRGGRYGAREMDAERACQRVAAGCHPVLAPVGAGALPQIGEGAAVIDVGINSVTDAAAARELFSNDELEKQFVTEAARRNLCSLKGHRSVGGIRASIYNAMPWEGVVALGDFMREFHEQRQG